MADSETIGRARRNGSSARQFVAPGERPVQVDEVVDLLEAASETGHLGVRRPANMLLEAMAHYGPWRVKGGRHPGGTGDVHRGPDKNQHITINVANCGYHLQLTLQNSIRRITGDQHSELVPPWLPPGAPVPTRER
jgi:hypothetical protein